MFRRSYTIAVKTKDAFNREKVLHVLTVKALTRYRAIEKAIKILKIEPTEYLYEAYDTHEKDILLQDLMDRKNHFKNQLECDRNFYKEIKSFRKEITDDISKDVSVKLKGLPLETLREVSLRIMFHSFVMTRALNSLTINKSLTANQLKYITTVNSMISDVLHNAPFCVIHLTDGLKFNRTSDELTSIIKEFCILMKVIESHMYQSDVIADLQFELRHYYRFSIDDYVTETSD